MAEGYSTVSYLTHPTLNVSAHFVIERDGDIVQMVGYDDASHSAHIAIDPDDADATDCGGLYNPATARLVLGSGWADINAYVVAVEVEGFRKDGPNTAQVDAIAELGQHLRAHYPTIRGNLGHRDVQDYKGCPGCRFPWAVIGGHGLTTGRLPMESDDVAIQLATRLVSDYRLDVPKDTPFWLSADLSGTPAGKHPAATLGYIGAVVGQPSRAVRIVTGKPYSDRVPRPSVCYVRESVGVPYYVEPPNPPDTDNPDPATDLGPGLYRVS